jgi:hypothetical protein
MAKRKSVVRRAKRAARRVAAGGTGSAKLVGYGGAIGAAVTLAKGNATLAEYLVRPYWQPVGLAILGHVLRKKPKSARFGEAALAVAGYQLGEQLTAGVVEPAAPESSAADAEGINTFGFDAQGINSFAFADDDDDEGQSATAAAPLQQLPEPAPAVAPTVADAAYMYY